MGKKKGYQQLIGGGDNDTTNNHVPKGYVPVLVGVENMKRFLVRVERFRQPCMVALLDMAAREFGHRQGGILKIPCDTDYFERVVHAVK
ncbi:hypothetical protein QJS10_CPB11g01543 [Acorus calamus]|uniref:Small auxin up regulated protein n=1 Tax=Acorus calamus TaxID=4465 RepID=A0AAV9DRH3_ACOCL|nr:hypothetical protein QJS10_CPB11g01543 [Acorus calamus]